MKAIKTLAQELVSQDRRALSKAITLIESSHPKDRERALNLLDELMPYTDHAIRIGITGSPGVGKSTFIEAYGQHLIHTGQRIAALTIDPSSKLTGGSILGDKTRMPTLANANNAFVRPTPSGNLLGGVARRSREVIALCAAAGYETILIETVGVGQSETDVANMTDCELLLLQPASGDTLQGIKRGIMELADIIIVNKADGALLSAARESATHYQRAVSLLPRKMKQWDCPVLLCSSVEEMGLDEIDKQIEQFMTLARKNGQFSKKRQSQKLDWLRDEVTAALLDNFWQDNEIMAGYEVLENEISHSRANSKSPARSANEFIRKTFKSRDPQ